MSKTRSLVVALLAVLVAGATLGWNARLRAAAPKPALQVTFGPLQVEGDARATFFLALHDTGPADAKLALGDEIEIRYGTRGGPGDLLAADTTLGVDPLPAGIALQRIADDQGRESGIRLAVQGDVAIDAGSALVLTFDGATAAAGGAPVALALRLSKAAGKYPRALTQTIVKTLPTGDVSLYGDGSDGALVVSADANLQTLRNHTDVLIQSGVTVTVASGTTIRCTGAFENRGRIVVEPGSPGGGLAASAAEVQGELLPQVVVVERGDAREAAEIPGVEVSQAARGGRGGAGLGTAVHSLPLSHYRHGGGGGSGALGSIGGAGGGLLRIVARGPVRNGGVIEAKGRSGTALRSGVAAVGSGGGGGGIVILASAASVENSAPANANGPAATGTISVVGGDGGLPDPLGGGGGGGGGGLVVLCAPSIPSNGTMNLGNGLTMSGAGAAQGALRAGGGGGGACAGDGGDGASVAADGTIGGVPARLPGPGLAVVRIADPRTLWW